MTEFRLATEWRIAAEIEPVWREISDVETWPEWWPMLAGVDALEPGDEGGLGARHRLTFRTRLPYRLSFETRVVALDRPVLLEAAIAGELAGTGRWRLAFGDGITAVRYDWNVRLTRPWMALLAPLARPVFVWNHHEVMRAGGRGLARHLDARLIAAGPLGGAP